MAVIYRYAALLLAACLLAACGEQDGAAPAPEVQVSAGRGLARAESAAKQAKPEAPPQSQPGAVLAYSYAMGISAPKAAIAPMAESHQQACEDAGPAVCQVLGSSINAWGEDHVSADLRLRATRQWLETFRGDITTDAERAGGRITSNTVNAEDLTQYIIDVEARLEAKKALRDRIMTMLEEREGGLSDVLAAERALADVQGEIDSMTASLEIAKRRVAMSALSISYVSDPATSAGLFKPLREAFGNFGRTSIASLADAVDFVARAWPFFIVLLIVLAILRVWWRGRRRSAS